MAEKSRESILAALLKRGPEGGRVLYLDTETTGLHPATSDLLEIAVVDESGDVLLETLVRPARAREWPEAQAVHGIAPEDVAGAPSLEDVDAMLLPLIEQADVVVIYNARFDLPFLPSRSQDAAHRKTACAMRAYSLHVGEWSEYWSGYRWFRLTEAAAEAGHAWSAAAHRALSDAQAARSVWRFLRERYLPLA